MAAAGARASDHPVGNKTPSSPTLMVNTHSQPTNQVKKKSRIDVKDVFNNDDDEDGSNNSKKRKLVPLGRFNYFLI